MRRTPVIVAVVGVLVAVLATDRLLVAEDPMRGGERGPAVAAPSGGSASTTWYCPGGSTSDDADAELTVVIANTNAEPIEGLATVLAFSPGAPTPPSAVQERFALDGHTRLVLNPKELVESPHVAVTVEVDGGGVVVEQGIASSLGFDLGPCAIAGSGRWYFADGATTRSSSMLLHLFNPFPAPAIVDMAFASTEGRAVPADLQGVVVPPRALVAVNVGDHVRREAAVSASVVARSGRLVVGKIVRRNEPGQRGIVAGLGAAATARTWRFPEGVAGGGVVERYHLYNPGGEEALVDLEMVLDDGIFEPMQIPVPAHGRTTLTVNAEEEAGVQVPEGIGHSALFRSLNDVGVVIERGLEGSGRRAGLASTLGAVEPAQRWGLAAGVATSAVEEWIVVQNASDAPNQVTVTAVGAGSAQVLDTLGGLTVPPLGRRGFKLNDILASAGSGEPGAEVLEAALVVEGDRPIVVERAMYRVGRAGMSTTLAIPFLP
ncbi:MAG: hypothetical protein KY395_02230 [Actinobacteria bacterium]|nr:hypothetical protein [Actinomycetota bacterium]